MKPGTVECANDFTEKREDLRFGLVHDGIEPERAGQLEDEMSRNVWLSAPADTDVLFHTAFAERLNVAAKALGIDFRLIAGRPGHA